jgi:hypothetical protein
MAALFGVLCAMATLWAGIRYEFAYRSSINTLPPQFQDDLSSRYAFPVYALEPSTPLPVQAEYVNAMWGFCVAALCLSLCFFSLQNFLLGGLIAIGAGWGAVSAMKSRKVFKANCERQIHQVQMEDT